MGLLIIFYALLVSLAQGATLDWASPLLRLLSFILLFSWAYGLSSSDAAKGESFFRHFFSISAILIVSQTIIDYAIDRNVFMNGGIRYFGSVGSPIGFAASTFVILTAIIYFWIESSRTKYFLLMLGLLWVVLMTGTRSISVFSLILVWGGWVLKVSGGARLLSLAALPIAAAFFASAFSDLSVLSRLEETITDGAIDNSTAFRAYILETYFSEVEIYEIIFGLGLGQFHKWFMGHTGISDVAPHFEFLWILAEFGIFGTVVYLAISFSLILGFLNRFRRASPAENFLFLTTFCTPQIFLQLANPFYFYQFYVPYAFLLAIAVSKFDMLRFNIFYRHA